jgi:lipoprotein-anchoring transpeptidase ErfK/SrfK
MSNPSKPRPPQRPSRAIEQSGILAVKTGFLTRTQAFRRPSKLFRPPLYINLGLLFAALVLAAVVGIHRRALDRRFDRLVQQNAAAPFELKRIRQELATMETDEKTLSRLLDARMKYLDNLKRNEFYISVDTKAQRLSFHYGDRIIRDAPVEVGPARTIEGKKGERWTFAPLTGSFNVRQKLEGASWRVPEWVYRMKGERPPRVLPRVDGGLGNYILVLSEDYVIHSPPAPESPLQGPKPGSFMVPEADLAAIWKRVGPETRVYIF